jgi:hypothetical protein
MRNRSHRFGLLLLALGAGAMWARPSPASLGGDAASVAADAAELHAVSHAIPQLHYDIQEITTETGMRVREFLNREGAVFAVTWNGPVVPDLRTLLGSSYSDYVNGLTAVNHSGTRRSLRMASVGLVLESGGHMRAYSGRAYLPALIPPGVLLSELR